MGGHLSAAWYDRLPAVTARIDCDGAGHRISWRGGRLILEDHDVLAERSLAALGGEPPLCLELFEAWSARRGSELVGELLLGERMLSREELALRKARHDSELEGARRMPEVMRAHHGSQPGAAERLRLVERQAAERLERERQTWARTLIEILPPRLRRALALSVIVSIERQWRHEGLKREQAREIEPALAKLATPLFEESARGWSRGLRPYRGFTAKAALVAPGERPACALWADRGLVHATLSLPLSWFVDVWARGLTLVSGCFVLAVTESSTDGSELRVLAVRLPRGNWKRVRTMEWPARVSRGGAAWQLRWL